MHNFLSPKISGDLKNYWFILESLEAFVLIFHAFLKNKIFKAQHCLLYCNYCIFIRILSAENHIGILIISTINNMFLHGNWKLDHEKYFLSPMILGKNYFSN